MKYTLTKDGQLIKGEVICETKSTFSLLCTDGKQRFRLKQECFDSEEVAKAYTTGTFAKK